ncbi:ELM1/GtrOC1 family putative glycosyltransferase [Desulforhopalus sp. IMCC35007]|uniref:ELM1/GtrOC1 family putative glycosyltransferase n=1 Tax=Desulforhopalus sp. IMCC35007 TaxID=2569543 RepID=UPI00145CB93A|nr:ELM1/GtrOC1 family putative glycosyltransferase [Desulforhopalus sp. IMCC35007]
MNNRKKEVLDVLVVVDGRPGHEKQSFGIIKALGNRVKVNTFVVDISKKKFFQQLKSYGTFFFSLPPGEITLPDHADLVIGTGTRTHSTVLNLKKYFKIPAVTCMTPSLHFRKYFDVCFVPEHDNCTARANYFFTYGAPNTSTDKRKHSEEKGLIVLGGVDAKSHDWNHKDITDKITKIIFTEKNIQWIVSSSPRTPAPTAAVLAEIARTADNAEFFDYKDTAKGWIEEQYDSCARVWVTTDSISMLYEALSSGCRVYVLTMPWKDGGNKFKKNEELLIKKGLVTPYSSWEKGKVDQSINTIKLNEAQRCADHILQTCWQEN